MPNETNEGVGKVKKKIDYRFISEFASFTSLLKYSARKHL
jgi:hypothetical protein